MAPSLTKNSMDSMALVDDDDQKQPFLVTLEASNFLANGHPFLTEVPSNIVATPSPFLTTTKPKSTAGCFIGFDVSAKPKSRHAVPIGKLKNIRFMSIFRFKVWWTTHWTGTNGRDVEHETQMMILDKNDFVGRPYVLLLPLLEGPFRASLQPGPHNDDDYVDLCVESGSTQVQESSFRTSLYMHAGDNPYALVKDAMNAMKLHLGTFRLLEEKTPPGIVDKFGWCTWDAFYLKVHPKGIWEGVKGLVEGKCPPGMVLIDDGWQSICHDDDDPITDQEGMNRTAAGEQMPCRLIKFEENYKFRDYESPKGSHNKGMGGFIRDLKEEFKTVEDVYVWHALCGYWGGVRPNVAGMPKSRVIIPKLSEGLEMTMEDLAVEKMVKNGVGFVPPELAHEMYEGLHSRLRAAGVDGVKVDVIHLLEMLCEEFGGRVELAKAYYKALTSSIRKHFKGNGVIASMEHCNDFMFLGTEAISLGRVGDDFWCTDPSGDAKGTYWLQGCHMVHCAYNSLWMGNFIHPDWDMFQSTHPCAEFHAASRSISGGPIYISDSVGHHDFHLLRRLVLPDASVLRCQFYALPTRDCLFEDPLHDGITLLKIWNLNLYTGVLGIFNCQGGGWCPLSRKNKSSSQYSRTATCNASPNDVEWDNSGKNPFPHIKDTDTFAIYKFRDQKLMLLKSSDNLELTLEPFSYELLTVSPVTLLPSTRVQFAPVGLVNMFNSGGAIRTLTVDGADGGGDMVRIGVKGSGEMKVFASEKPVACKVDGVDVEFLYDDDNDDHIVTIQVHWSDSPRLSVIEYLF